jgi:hypothetical protein
LQPGAFKLWWVSWLQLVYRVHYGNTFSPTSMRPVWSLSPFSHVLPLMTQKPLLRLKMRVRDVAAQRDDAYNTSTVVS